MELVIEMKTGAETGATPAAPEATEIPQAVPEAVLREPGTASDADLVMACLAGEPHYFGVLVQRYTGVVISFSRSRVSSAELAEEVAQETMVRAYEQLLRLRVPRTFSSWLVGIASHVISRMRNEWSGTLPLAEAMPGGTGVPTERIAAGRSGTDGDKRWGAIVNEVNALPARYRIIVVLKHLDGLSCRDISERLGLPIGTVTGRLSRGYTMLRERLIGRKGGESEGG